MARSSTSFKSGPSTRRHRLTAEDRRKGGLASAHNLVPMTKGADPRRHRLTEAECSEGGRRGFEAVMEKRPEVLLWLKRKLKAQGRRQKRRAS